MRLHQDGMRRRNRFAEASRRVLRRPRGERRGTSRRAGLEMLEPRVLLSPTVYSVNSTSYFTTGTGTSGTFPYVVGLADANTSPDGSLIEFDPSVFRAGYAARIVVAETLVLSDTLGPITIDGPGALAASISGGGKVGVFEVESGVTATISGLTISRGSTSQSGGGVYNLGSTTLTDCNVADNTAEVEGGGIDNAPGATLSLIACTVSGNTARTSNSAGASNESSYSQPYNSNEYNYVYSYAGKGGTIGGGIANAGTATITNCTISGNSAGYGGGLENTGTATISASTFSRNPAVEGGGGIYDSGSGRAVLEDTIVAGNRSSLVAGDISGNAASAVTGTYNLIGTGGSGAIAGGSSGNIVLTSLANLGLGYLNNWGGPTATMALLPGSAALGVGIAKSGITTDQRGQPIAAAPDIGAFQSQGFTINPVPGIGPQQATDGTAFASPLSVVVTANNQLDPVAGGTVTFTAPASGASAALTAETVTLGYSGSASVVAADNSIPGSYTVTASAWGAASVSFSLTNAASLPVTSYTVTSTSGEFSGYDTSGSLPYVTFLASADANPATGPITINFDPSVFSAPETIALGATLDLTGTTDPIWIDGPTSDSVTIKDLAFGILDVARGVTARLSGLTISDGNAIAGNGGGVDNYGTLDVDDCTISFPIYACPAYHAKYVVCHQRAGHVGHHHPQPASRAGRHCKECALANRQRWTESHRQRGLNLPGFWLDISSQRSRRSHGRRRNLRPWRERHRYKGLVRQARRRLRLDLLGDGQHSADQYCQCLAVANDIHQLYGVRDRVRSFRRERKHRLRRSVDRDLCFDQRRGFQTVHDRRA